MSLETHWILIGYGGMLLILLSMMLFKDREIKFRLRVTGYAYMIGLESIHSLFTEGLWFTVYHGVLVTFWIWLAYKDIKTTRMFDREFARLDKLKAKSEAAIAQLFYHRRN